MKNIRNKYLLILIIFVLLVLFYFLINSLYMENLIAKDQKTVAVRAKKITKDNYKNIEYERVHILCCDGQVIDFEKLYFSNDSTLIIEKDTYAFDNMLTISRLFGLSNSTEEKFHFKNDTLTSKSPINLGGFKITNFFTFKFEGDSLAVGKYEEIRECEQKAITGQAIR